MGTKINYVKLANAALRLIDKAGGPRKLIKTTRSGDPARPTLTPAEHPCLGIEFQAVSTQIDGVTVLEGDKVAYVAPDLVAEAVPGDIYLDAFQDSYKIQKVEKIAPNGVVLLWTYFMRK